jgi:putative hydrolase of the HAD superfamily
MYVKRFLLELCRVYWPLVVAWIPTETITKLSHLIVKYNLLSDDSLSMPRSRGEKLKKTKISALILDYGGVISQPQNRKNVDNILRLLGQDYDEFMQVYYDLRVGYDSGELSGEGYWVEVLRHFGLNPNGYDLSSIIHEDVNSWTHLNQEMLFYLRENRDRIPKLAMISNMVDDTLVYMREHYDWLDLFDELVFSCELGVNKPEKEIYSTCLQKIDVPPSECLFVDDSPKNVDGAIRVGMQAIQFVDYPQFVLELEEKVVMTS